MDTVSASKDAQQKRPGNLTIFCGYFPGSGKRHAMLCAAEKERRLGKDVVVAFQKE